MFDNNNIGNNSNIINGNHNTVIYTTNSFRLPNTCVEKKTVTLKKLILENIIKAIITTLIGMIIPYLFKIIPVFSQSNNLFDILKYLIEHNDNSFSTLLNTILLFLPFLAIPIVLLHFVSIMINFIYIIKLRSTGTFVEFATVQIVFSSIVNLLGTNDLSTRKVKAYKNIGGKIFRIKYKTCPICATNPKGKMILYYSNKCKYSWKCNNNPEHVLSFDYTQNF